MEIITAKYDTASMIENIVNSISKRAADKGLVFEAHIASDLPTALLGDDMRVSQVAVNLLTNAVKYTKKGRVDLFIDGKREDDKVLRLRIKVKDTGIGIKEEDMSRLFESFTRLEENRNRNIEGTGLGMAIVNRLLEMMDSKLEVHSVYGEGSEFSFVVNQPIIDSSPIGDYAARAREALENEKNDRYLYAPEAKLLIVDDNDMNLKVAENLLRMNGIRPDLVLSGAEALEKMKSNAYDVIMLDHMMPEMDGIETLQKAKEEGLIAEGCSVIVLTANAVVGARENYIKAGFDDYLSKPIDVKMLENILAKYLPSAKVEYKSRSEKDESVDAKEIKASDESTAKLYMTLEANGISTRDALNCCGGNEAFYKDILREYGASCDTRIKELNEAAEANDLKAYGIKVHSLKSISRTIGARALSEAAAGLEAAADSGDSEAIRSGNSAITEQYRKIADVIASAGLSPEGATQPDDDDDDEIMEFMPK